MFELLALFSAELPFCEKQPISRNGFTIFANFLHCMVIKENHKLLPHCCYAFPLWYLIITIIHSQLKKKYKYKI